ncbi:TniB family NTP-binding protein [Hymenobacter sediminicola]|uniref:TniB family NTP-binding protein n=1 Tax=Hymenobacter sediminicola TaxID=2761579 RepID=A0A7G7W8T9_9BACT|nr:TniB family NTP-binding protein [Hymenobacter sediminicola]QNH62782.1 TniB family NTP-binding protein [Hymenobacter sediminicola]
MEHLIEGLYAVALGDTPSRIHFIQSNRWIKYPAAERILERLEELLVHPKIARMPNLLLVGETNNGKTLLLKKFCQQHKPYATPGDEKMVRPVITVEAPPKPDEKQFYRRLLDQLNAPYRLADRMDRMERQVFHVMQHLNARMLIIDEIQNLLAGSSTSQRVFLNVLKGMANELQIIIVAAGTMEARNAMSADPQMANRFVQKFLPKWHYAEDYLRLLASFERLLPLRKASGLSEPAIAERIYAMSEGTIGEISAVITAAAVAAIRSGKEHIDRKLLDQIDYVLPSERRRFQGVSS